MSLLYAISFGACGWYGLRVHVCACVCVSVCESVVCHEEEEEEEEEEGARLRGHNSSAHVLIVCVLQPRRQD